MSAGNKQPLPIDSISVTELAADDDRPQCQFRSQDGCRCEDPAWYVFGHEGGLTRYLCGRHATPFVFGTVLGRGYI